ncbi:hypothetical protein [Pseudochrobactrum lubricantis]|uniref:hypothetical protein n=1 Tax=Pseudochrobactrum lubricantis TaxID=558172 RepID=UPI0035D7AC12
MKLRVLLVEDEEHKTTDLVNRLNFAFPKLNLHVARSVREAVLEVLENEFELVVLDMALPTFSDASRDEGGGGVSQAIGGVEVLRSLQSANQMCNIIIVTQYPEIIISGERVKLNQIGKVVSRRYNQNILGVVLYSFKTIAWEENFDKLLGAMSK